MTSLCFGIYFTNVDPVNHSGSKFFTITLAEQKQKRGGGIEIAMYFTTLQHKLDFKN